MPHSVNELKTLWESTATTETEQCKAKQQLVERLSNKKRLWTRSLICWHYSSECSAPPSGSNTVSGFRLGGSTEKSVPTLTCCMTHPQTNDIDNTSRPGGLRSSKPVKNGHAPSILIQSSSNPDRRKVN